MKTNMVSRKDWFGPVLAVLVFEGDRAPLGMPGVGGRKLLEDASSENFKGQFKRTALAAADGLKVMLCGLGKRKDFEPCRVRTAMARALKRAEEMGLAELSLLLPEAKETRGKLDLWAAWAVEGVALSGYRFNSWRTPKPDETMPPQVLNLVFPAGRDATPVVRRAVERAVAVCEAVGFTRDLVNEPPSPKVPEKLAARGAELAQDGRVTVKVIKRAELEKLGMGGILGVGRGSHEPPCLVHLSYVPKAKPKKTLCFIGKGVTFDSGGLSLKPSAGMEAMKDDMAGAASVLGLFHYLRAVDAPVAVHGLVPLAENMPGGGAHKPSDVVRHYGGKTSEIISTDAEGRLILADALAYASETIKPDLMVDIATLTGACVVALGDEYSALLGTDRAAIQRITRLGLEQDEYFWELPLVKRYRDHIKSKVADMKNTGKPGVAGTITAGLFLQEFVGEGVPWVHIDIAGPSFTKEGWDYVPAGGTGVPLRTMIALVHSYGQ
ncbi:MAG: leucyl aminopeptidase [bacterium]